jgi:antirestriction protein ArdC
MSVNENHPKFLAQLTEGIAKLTTSEEWQKFLDVQSRFHHYSFNNVLLIAMQKHDAIQVAGFNAWRTVGRTVRKGEKGIRILAPMTSKNAQAQDVDDDRVTRGFKWVPVFDVSQTDGEKLPCVCNRLAGNDPFALYPRLVAVAHSVGFTVEDAELPENTNGNCSYDLRRIQVEMSNSPAQRVKTLVHEIAHAILHADFDDRRLAELEAESIAYVVCASLGLSTDDYSFGYVATWAGGGDEAIAGIKASCDRIQKTAATVLRPFDIEEDQQIA